MSTTKFTTATYARLRATLHANGVPPGKTAFCARLAADMIKGGVIEAAALLLARDAYRAANLYTWYFDGNYAMQSTLEREHARLNPNGKCAEDLRARAEGRPSRWGTPEFHRASVAA